MKTIMLVDDDVAFRTAVSKSLSRAGYHVLQAKEGGEALKLFPSTPPDLVITDLIMPGKEGIELISNLRKLHPALPIIAISGGGRNSPLDYLPIAQALGAAKTLVKPFLTQELLSAVESILGPQPVAAS